MDLSALFPSEEEMELNSIKRYGAAIVNPTDFINWYFRIKDVVKTPASKCVVLDKAALDIFRRGILDGTPGWEGAIEIYIKQLNDWIVENSGYPAFIKSGVFSGKHTYSSCCVVENLDQLYGKFSNILYNQECVGCELSATLVARELLDVSHSKFTAFDGMPVVREFRFFCKDGAVESFQEYWIKDAIRDHTEFKDWESELDNINKITPEELKYLTAETAKVLDALKGDLSVDWLQDANGEWWCIDLAEYHKSFKVKNRTFLNN